MSDYIRYWRRIAVGSNNPVKIAAVESVFKRLKLNAEIVAISVPSGVSDQPRGDDEAIRGASNRARAALAAAEADAGIGQEAMVHIVGNRPYLCGWTAVCTPGNINLGSGGHIMLPARAWHEVQAGVEVGLAMDHLTGLHNSKQSLGSVGILTAELYDRQRALEQELAYALTVFLNPDAYQS